MTMRMAMTPACGAPRATAVTWSALGRALRVGGACEPDQLRTAPPIREDGR